MLTRLARRCMSSTTRTSRQHADLFTAGGNYNKFRPRYPPQVYARVRKYLDTHNVLASSSSSSLRPVVADVGCGTGQATFELAKAFPKAQVIGVDGSADQVGTALETLSRGGGAAEVDNVGFVVGVADALPFEDDSVDVVTVAQALHWFAEDFFYKEVGRVLRPGGALAVWTYGPVKTGDAAMQEVVEEFQFGEMGPYWDTMRAHVDNNYADIVLPESIFSDCERVAVDGMDSEMDMASFLGYVNTMSCLKTYRSKHGTTIESKDDPLRRLAARLRKVYDESKPVSLHFDVTLLLGRVKET